LRAALCRSPKRAKGEHSVAETYTDRIMDDLRAAYARIDELEAALREIVTLDMERGSYKAVRLARKALGN
jgi:hypothetical protein